MRIDLLSGKKAERHYSNRELAEAIGRSPSYIAENLKSPGNFKVAEAVKLCDLLGIELAEMHKYFAEEESSWENCEKSGIRN